MFEAMPDVISVEQLCQMLHISRKTGYDLVRQNILAHRKVGRQYRICKEAVIKFMKGD